MEDQSARPRKKGNTNSLTVKAAVEKVVKTEKIRPIAKEFNNARQTLKDWVDMYKKARAEGTHNHLLFEPNYAEKRIFTDEEEKSLEKYLCMAVKMHYGLTSKDLRQLACEMAIANKKFSNLKH